MDLIQSYESEESFTEVSTGRELKPRQLRSVYLVTYSQADFKKFPSREIFAETVAAQFFTSTNVKVVQWAHSMEEYKSTGGYHCHMCIKINRNKRLMPVKQKMFQEHGVQLHFSSAHTNYYSAWKYTTKSDKSFIQSTEHPDLTEQNSPKTKAATKNCIRKKVNKNETAKKKLLAVPEVSNIIRTKQIKTKQQLYALTEIQRKEGKSNLYGFIITKSAKKVSELISTTMELQRAPADLIRSQKTRLEILQGMLTQDCIQECNNTWCKTAIQTLERNNICLNSFCSSIRTLFDKGRGKF